MNIDKRKFEHLINNIERISSKKSIFNYESGRRALLSLGQGNISEWLEKLLPNTRLILEPKIIGSSIGIQYINGQLNKAINENSGDITEKVLSIRTVPKSIPIKRRIEIRGVLYKDKNKSHNNKKTDFIDIKNISTERNELNFCVFNYFIAK